MTSAYLLRLVSALPTDEATGPGRVHAPNGRPIHVDPFAVSSVFYRDGATCYVAVAGLLWIVVGASDVVCSRVEQARRDAKDDFPS